MKYLVSVLIPTLLERREKFNNLLEKIQIQIDDYNLKDLVEVISICDNRNLRLCDKRNRMQNFAQGEYFFHLDDDDSISDDYFKVVCDEIKKLQKKDKDLPDMITYDQFCKVNGNEFIVSADLKCKSFGLVPVSAHNNMARFTRVPWQFHLWRTKKFSHIWRTDVDTNAREDQNWLKKIYLEYPKTQHHIDKILHYYYFGTDGIPTTCQ